MARDTIFARQCCLVHNFFPDVAEEFRTLNESDFHSTADDNAEEFEVWAAISGVPEELEDILDNADFLAPQ